MGYEEIETLRLNLLCMDLINPTTENISTFTYFQPTKYKNLEN